MIPPVLELKNYSVSFDTSMGEAEALKGVELSVAKGEILCLIGESGCGKTVLCRSVMKLTPANCRITSGSVLLDGKDITSYDERSMRHLRGSRMSMVFQDPAMALDPVMPVGRQITEVLLRKGMNRSEANDRMLQMLTLAGIGDADACCRLRPHHFSGGMKQRIALAAALSAEPGLLFADEPTSSLDVITATAVLDLLADMNKRIGTAIVLVTHDLGAAARIADRIGIMYAGRMVEIGTAMEIFHDPRHPYTWGLLSSLPAFADNGRLHYIPGVPPGAVDPPPGDAFAERNGYALAIDYDEAPPMTRITDTHYAASWLLDERAPVVRKPEYLDRDCPFA